MRRREFLGWSTAIGLPLSVPFVQEINENISNINEASDTPLGEALASVEDKLNEESFYMGVVPKEETAYRSLEDEADNSYELGLTDQGFVRINIDASDTDFDTVFEDTIKSIDGDRFADDLGLDGSSLSEDEFYKEVLENEDAFEQALLQTTDLLAAYAEATVASELEYYEGSSRAEPGFVEEMIAGDPQTESVVSGYELNLDNVEVDGTSYQFNHRLTADQMEEIVSNYGFSETWSSHLQMYRDDAQIQSS